MITVYYSSQYSAYEIHCAYTYLTASLNHFVVILYKLTLSPIYIRAVESFSIMFSDSTKIAEFNI